MVTKEDIDLYNTLFMNNVYRYEQRNKRSQMPNSHEISGRNAPNTPTNFGTARRCRIIHASNSQLAEINEHVDEFFQKERERDGSI